MRSRTICLLVTVLLPFALSGCERPAETVTLDKDAPSEGAASGGGVAESEDGEAREGSERHTNTGGRCRASTDDSGPVDEADAEAEAARLDDPRVRKVFRYARTVAKPDLAAVFVDHGRGSIPTIAVARNFAQHRRQLMQLVGAENVVVRREKFTQRELGDIHRVLSREVAHGGPWTFVSTVDSANQVQVGVDLSNRQAVADLRARFPRDAICIIPPPTIVGGPERVRLQSETTSPP